jgi:hypothetical protein
VVELLELFELVGLESFERSKNFLDGGLPRLCGVMLPILKGQVADRQLLQHFSGNYWMRLNRVRLLDRHPETAIGRSLHFFSKIGRCRVWMIAVTSSDLTSELVTAK